MYPNWHSPHNKSDISNDLTYKGTTEKGCKLLCYINCHVNFLTYFKRRELCLELCAEDVQWTKNCQ